MTSSQIHYLLPAILVEILETHPIIMFTCLTLAHVRFPLVFLVHGPKREDKIHI